MEKVYLPIDLPLYIVAVDKVTKKRQVLAVFHSIHTTVDMVDDIYNAFVRDFEARGAGFDLICESQERRLVRVKGWMDIEKL